MKRILALIAIFSVSYAHAAIFALGGGKWDVASTDKEYNNTPVLDEFTHSKFVRLSHEGAISSNLLYSVSAGLNLSDVKSYYQYEGQDSTTTLAGLESEISMAEARIGFKYNLGSVFYLGAGGILGDFQINYDRDDFVALGGDTSNYKASENRSYVGHFYEAGIMLLSKHWGLRLGGEINSVVLQKNVKTLGNSQPQLNSQKVYMEILWKN